MEKRLVIGKKGRIALIVTACVLVAAIVTGLCLYFLVFKKEDEGYYKYFNEFSSQELTKAVARSNLSEGTSVHAYDSVSDVFITKRTYVTSTDTTAEGYGLASADEEYVLPIYSRILQIRGDYAMVVRSAIVERGETHVAGYVDVIRFRGEENTPYSLTSDYSIPYSSTALLPQFVGNYIVAFNTLGETVLTPTYATFYEYKSWHKVLEKFRIRQAYDKDTSSVYSFIQAEDYVVAYSTDKAYFYNVNNTILNGYLEHVDNGAYVAFPDFDAETLNKYYRELDVYYIGNGWFARSARLYLFDPFNGFNVVLLDSGIPEYSRTKVDFFNARTMQSRTEKEIDYIAGVANEYSNEKYERDAYYMSTAYNYDTDYGVYDYELPFFNPAKMVKKGYSLVYYYYQPYHDVYPDGDRYLSYTGATTFFIMDENLRLTSTENSLMPILYVDDVGFANSDPTFHETRGNAYVYDKNLKTTTLATAKEGLETYYVYYANKEACIIEANITTDDGTADAYFGATTPDGKRITDFVYDEMTYYAGGYCLAQKKADGKAKYYRVDLKGTEVEVEDVDMVFQGFYTFKDGEKIGVKNYAGEVLIESVKGTINVASSVMKNGKDVHNYVAVTQNDRTTIYELTSDK